MEQKEKKGSFMEKLATLIVDKRNVFFLIYIFAGVFCLFSMISTSRVLSVYHFSTLNQ